MYIADYPLYLLFSDSEPFKITTVFGCLLSYQLLYHFVS